MKVFLTYHPNDAAFTNALASLIVDVLGLDPNDVVAEALDQQARNGSNDASSIPMLVEVVSQYRPLPAHPSATSTDVEMLRVQVSLDGLRPRDRSETMGWMLVDAGSTFALEELLGSAAGRLGVTRALDLLPYRQRFEQLAVLGRGTSGEHQSAMKKRVRLAYGGALAALGVSAYCWLYPPWGHGRFEFEAPDHGWQQTRDGAKACRGVSRSDAERRRGSYSLELDMDLEPSQPDRLAGEAWMDVSANETGSLDLSNQRVTAWVFAPPAAAGPPERPNGYQLFVKDADYRSHYGPWVNARGGEWTEVELRVGQPSQGSTPAPGFDATKVHIVGIKVALGSPPREAYAGPVYLDSVDW